MGFRTFEHHYSVCFGRCSVGVHSLLLDWERSEWSGLLACLQNQTRTFCPPFAWKFVGSQMIVESSLSVRGMVLATVQ